MTPVLRHIQAGLLFGLFALATVVYGYHVTTSSNSNSYVSAYVDVLVTGACLLTLLLALCVAVLSGMRPPQTWPSAVGGLVLGTFVGVLVIAAQDEERARPGKEWRKAYEREQLSIAQQFLAGDLNALPARLGSLQHGTFENTVCDLVGDDAFRAALAHSGEQAPESNLGIPTPRLLGFADALAKSNIPQQRKLVGLFAVLSVLANRKEAPQALVRWLDDWRIAHGDPNLRELRLEQEFSFGGVCPLGSTAMLSDVVVEGMKDAGVLAWLDQGFTFLPEQQHFVLMWIKAPSTVRALVQSGVDLKGLVDRDGKPRSLLYDQTSLLFDSILMFRPDHLTQIADLMETYVKLGADPQAAPDGQTACELYRSRYAVACAANECDFVSAPLERIERIVCGPVN